MIRDFTANEKQPKALSVEWLEVVKQHVGSLNFGVVQIVVHESQVVQVERTERIRFRPKRNVSEAR